MTQPVEPWIVEAFEKKTWLSTRGGDRRRVICVDAPGIMPVIAISESGEPTSHTLDGSFHCNPGSRISLLPPRRTWDVCVIQYDKQNATLIFACDWEHYDKFHSWKLLARATIEEGSGLE